MREVEVKFYDDLDYAEDKTKTEAAQTVTVGFNGTWRELDLSEKNHDLVTRTISEWMRAGHVPDTDPRPRVGGPNTARRSTRGKCIPRESLEHGRAIRAFAKENGYNYLTSTGKYYYSERLKKAYAAHVAELNQQGRNA